MNANEIRSPEAEAGVIASILMKPDLVFLSDGLLKPNYFTDRANAYIYWAVSELARRGIEQVDEYNVYNMLSMHKGTGHVTEELSQVVTPASLQELFRNAQLIARNTPEDYKLVAQAVADAAFRRYTIRKLAECQQICYDGSEKEIRKVVQEAMDGVMLEFSTADEIPRYGDVVEKYWQAILAKQNPDNVGVIPFKFPHLNEYVMIERSELIVVGAPQKTGKSIFLLNCAADLLKRGVKVFYLDSELNSELFTCRLLSHLTGVTFRNIRHGRYSAEDGEKIQKALRWLKEKCQFTHLYMPDMDETSIYTAIKKVYHTQGIDVLIFDYFKGSSEKDAFASYQSLGGLVDLIKNKVCGELNIAGLGACQLTSTGKIADSAKIARNASTILTIEDKTLEEIEADGPECGNRRLVCRFNRNGPQMTDGEYIDLNFDGDRILFTEAKQHKTVDPY